MSYPNSQGNPASSIPVWLDVQPAANGPYPNGKNVTGGAIPVYEVAAPANTPPFPNNQGTATAANAGALPVRVVAKPTGGAANSNDPSNDLAAIPVWVVSSATGKLPVYPNQQGNANGAIPVYVVS